MLTGRRAFRGETKVSTIAAIPEPRAGAARRNGTPRELGRIVRGGLRKDLARRRADHDGYGSRVAEELKDESDSAVWPRRAMLRSASKRRWLAGMLASVAAIAARWRTGAVMAVGRYCHCYRRTPDKGQLTRHDDGATGPQSGTLTGHQAGDGI